MGHDTVALRCLLVRRCADLLPPTNVTIVDTNATLHIGQASEVRLCASPSPYTHT